MPIKCTVFYFTPCPVPSCPTYEPNSNDGEYSQPFRHIQYTSEPPASAPSLPGNALVSAHRQVHVPTSPLRIASCCRLGGRHQQETQQGIALLADVPQPLLAGTGVLTRNHPHLRADLLAAVETLRSSDDQYISERHERAHARMGHQPLRLASFLTSCSAAVVNSSVVEFSRRRQELLELLDQGARESFSSSARP